MKTGETIIELLESANAQLAYLAELVEGNPKAEEICARIARMLQDHHEDLREVVLYSPQEHQTIREACAVIDREEYDRALAIVDSVDHRARNTAEFVRIAALAAMLKGDS